MKPRCHGGQAWVLVVLCLAGVAYAQEPIPTTPYVVQAGDTCVTIAIKQLGSRDAYRKLHELNNMGPLPHRLAPGTVLRLPVKDNSPDARLTAARGLVQVQRPAMTAWDAAVRGMELFRAWRVGSRAQAFAELTFRNASKLKMRENTVVVIYGPSATSRLFRGADATLEFGVLDARLSELRGSAIVVTPSARTELRQGRSLIDVDAAGTSRVANHAGERVTVRGLDAKKRPRRKQVEVQPDMGSKVVRGADPTPPRALPAPPAWVKAEPLTLLVGDEPLMVEWTPGPDGTRYRLVLVVNDEEQPAILTAATHAELRGLAPGDYRATVAAIDADGFEGRPSEEARLRVARAGLVGGASSHQPGEAFTIETSLACALHASKGRVVSVIDGDKAYESGTLRCTRGALVAERQVAVEPMSVAVLESPQTWRVGVGQKWRVGGIGPTQMLRADGAVLACDEARPVVTCDVTPVDAAFRLHVVALDGAGVTSFSYTTQASPVLPVRKQSSLLSTYVTAEYAWSSHLGHPTHADDKLTMGIGVGGRVGHRIAQAVSLEADIGASAFSYRSGPGRGWVARAELRGRAALISTTAARLSMVVGGGGAWLATERGTSLRDRDGFAVGGLAFDLGQTVETLGRVEVVDRYYLTGSHHLSISLGVGKSF